MLNTDLDRMLAFSAEARKHPGWARLADYLSLHGQGVRKRALVTLSSFIEDAMGWPLKARLDLSLWILETLRLSSIPAPLFTSIVLPTCEDWIQEEPENAEAHLWLGKLNPSIARQEFTLALALAPENDEARGRLCQSLIDHIDFNQHHLPHFYINDPKLDLIDLSTAEALWIGREQSKWAKFCLNDIRGLRKCAEMWLLKKESESTIS